MGHEIGENFLKWYDVVLIATVVLTLIVWGYVFFYSDENVCLTFNLSEEGNYDVDLNDTGKKCFKGFKELRVHQEYLINKYDLGYNYDLSMNIS